MYDDQNPWVSAFSQADKNRGQATPILRWFFDGDLLERTDTIVPNAHDTLRDDESREESFQSSFSSSDEDSSDEEIVLGSISAATEDSSQSEATTSLLGNFVLSEQESSSEEIEQVPDITGPNVTVNSSDPVSQSEALTDIGDSDNGQADDLDEATNIGEAEIDITSWSPLHYTASEGNLILCRALLEKGAFVDARDSRNQTPLSYAAQDGHIDVCNVLFDFGAEPDTAEEKGATPLIMAGLRGHIDVVRLLISRGANVKTRTHNGRTPLSLVVSKDLINESELLSDVARVLLDNGCDPNTADDDDPTPLGSAVLHNGLSCAELLLAYNADPNIKCAKDKHSLMLAVENDGLDMVRLLLQHGADPNVVDAAGRTVLHLAVQEDNRNAVQMIDLLLAAKDMDVNVLTHEGSSALALAARTRTMYVVKALLAAGADPDMGTINNMTALQQAVASSRLPMVGLLLQYGANPKQLDRRGFSILHIAAIQSDVAVLKKIFDEDVDLELRTTDPSRLTALQLAVRNTNVNIAIMLLDYGARPGWEHIEVGPVYVIMYLHRGVYGKSKRGFPF